jgi:hypothetical protein
MGREIRKVPANWEHPVKADTYGRERLQPMYDETFADAAAKWKENFLKWESGERPSYCTDEHKNLEYWEWENSPPDRDYYRPWSDDEATWFQVWETVSEGTPVSPPFATEEELIEYLAENGDFWDQKRRKEPDWVRIWGGVPGVSGWGRQQAERFVKAAWAPSMIAFSDGAVVEGKLAS